MIPSLASIKNAVGEAMSITTVVATLAGALPYIAALLSAVWYGVQLYGWYKSRKDKQ